MPNNFMVCCLLVSYFLMTGCIRPSSPPEKQPPGREKETMEKVNRLLAQKDEEVIASFVERMGWEMNLSPSGLWYSISNNGEGEKIEAGVRVRLFYRLSLLDGTLCYSSGTDGPREFTVGKGGVEQGLEEGILLLSEGDQAKFIMPPHLAHGLLGDQERIPARSIILYEIDSLRIIH